MKLGIFSAVLLLLLSGCSLTDREPPAQEEQKTYQQISSEQAKDMMGDHPRAVILDVREQHEFESGHIPGAVLLSVNAITEESAAAVIPDKKTMVLVYCRSGNRSKTASQKLTDLGYSEVYEFGGILDWPYEIVQ